MAAVGRATAVGPRLLISQGKSLLILQLNSISRSHSTIYHLVDEDGSSHTYCKTKIFDTHERSAS